MKKDDEPEFALRRETGELYMLDKKERILVTELLKTTLATAAGREFLGLRFGKEGLKIATGLLQEMGVHLSQRQGQKPKTVS